MTRQDRLQAPFVEDEFLQQRHWRDMVLLIFLPAVEKSVDKRDSVECALAGARLKLAIDLHRAHHGRYPNDLAALVPQYLPSIPSDPFSDIGFIYQLLGDGDDYLLYSVGIDGVDNGGRFPPERGTALSTRGGHGFDYALNPPPRGLRCGSPLPSQQEPAE